MIMNKLTNIVFLTDIVKLPKDTLKEICTDFDIDDNGHAHELATSVWNHIQQHGEQIDALERSKKRLLAGKTSVTWYRLERGTEFKDIKNKIIQNTNFNLFQETRIPSIESLTTDPVIVAGAEGDVETQYYLRFMYKSGVSREYHLTEMKTSPRSEITTVFIDESTGLIEVRSDARKSDKVAKSLAKLVDSEVILEQVVAPYGTNIEEIATQLNGELIDVVSKPEFVVEDLSPAQGSAVVKILNSLDSYLKSNDISELENDLMEANEVFDEQLLTVPFAALILNGLEKVGFGGERELRGLSLYDSLNPYLQHQGGFIRFKYPEEGVEKEYTIRLGIKSKSIYFATSATEDVIDFVRRNVIIS